MRFVLGSIVMLLAAVCLWFAGTVILFANSPSRAQSPDTIILEVARGQTPASISRQLRSLRVVDDETLFLWLGKARGDWSKLKAGEYRIGPGMTPLEIFAILKSGISIHRPVTIREGENMYEVARQLELKGLAKAKEFLELCKNTEFM